MNDTAGATGANAITDIVVGSFVPPPDNPYPLGTQIKKFFKEHRAWYRGTILSYNDTAHLYKVKFKDGYKDGDEEELEHREIVVVTKEANDVVLPPPDLPYEVGTWVKKFLYEYSGWYEAKIISYNSKTYLYKIEYEDGDQEELDHDEINTEPFPMQPVYRSGMKIEQYFVGKNTKQHIGWLVGEIVSRFLYIPGHLPRYGKEQKWMYGVEYMANKVEAHDLPEDYIQNILELMQQRRHQDEAKSPTSKPQSKAKKANNMEATQSFPDVVTSRGIDDFSLDEKEDYESLQKIYLTKQLRTGSGAELPGNMTLRKIVKPPKIHHRLELKKKLDVLAKQGHHGERYRLLQLLRDVETKPSQFGGNIPTDLVPGLLAGNEDVAEVIYIRDDERIKKSNALPINNKVIHLNSTMTTKKKHPKEYTQQDVTDFLSAIGLGHKSKEFEYNAVDGSMLATLTPEDFKNELGFTKLQTRKFLIYYQQLIDDCARSNSMKNSSSNGSNDNDPTKMKDNVNGVIRCDLDHPMEKMLLASAKPSLAVEQILKRRRSRPSSVNKKKKKQKMIRSSKNACAGNTNKKQKTASQKYFLEQINMEGDYNMNSNVLPFERSKTCLWGKLTRGYATIHKEYAPQFKKLYRNGKPGQDKKKIQGQIIQDIVDHCESAGYQFRHLPKGEQEANAVVIGYEHPEMRKGFQRIFSRED